MASGSNPLGFLKLVGGRPCLDFTNTVGARDGGVDRDYLNAYADVAWWAEHAGLVDAATGAALRSRAAAEPAAAAEVYARAIDLREALYWLFSAVAAGRAPAAADVELLNRELATAMAQAVLRPDDGGFEWAWREGDRLDRVLWPVARSAAELLTAPELARVGACPGERCGWLYLDTSKNRSRRWCDMRDCGNREKARRHHARLRRGRGASPQG